MADVDNMSDAEIRSKLIEFGFPVMPITGTTRKVMMKKLKLLLDSKTKTTSSSRRSLAQFSSEEESEGEVAKPTKKDKNRRATMAVVPPTMQPPIASKGAIKKAAKKIDNEFEVVETAPAPTKTTIREERKTTRTTKILNMVDNNKDLDTNSDSEPEIVETDYKVTSKTVYDKGTPEKSPVSSSSSYNYPEPKSYSTPKDPEMHASRNTGYLSGSPGRYSTYGSPVDASDKLNQVRSRLSLGNHSSYEPSYTPIAESKTDNAPTPFLSNFTKRLSQLSNNKGDYIKTDGIKEQDTNGSGLYNRSYLTRPKPREFTRDFQATPETSKSNYISFVLIGCVALFFIIIMALYWGMHSGNNSSDIVGLKVPHCEKNDHDPKRGESCLADTDVNGALDIYKVLKPVLIHKAISFKCGFSNEKPYMTEEDIVSYIRENFSIEDTASILEDLNSFVILLFKNLLWDVTILQTNTRNFSPDNKVDSLDTIYKNKMNGYKTAFIVLEPSLPWKCSFYIRFAFLVKALATALIIALVWKSSQIGYKYYKHFQETKKIEVVLLVEKIIDILQINATEEADGFLVINHVRDMILPIDNRQRLEKAWAKAVEFIKENESRVRTEVQVVKGEPYEVWRWLGALSTSPGRNKSWQGQAFETQIGSVNSPPCSPTPCLKIRGMVDDGDRNLQTIREAVLVKCADDCHTLHCAVDVNSKCVYLKCADQNDAAIAYRNLHGWWYASHLVTVKYLRLERYMQRFPDSPQSGPPFLKASQPAKEWA